MGLFDSSSQTNRGVPEQQSDIRFSHTSLWRGASSDYAWTICGKYETLNGGAPFLIRRRNPQQKLRGYIAVECKPFFLRGYTPTERALFINPPVNQSLLLKTKMVKARSFFYAT